MAPRRSPLRADADVMEIRITNIVFVEHEGRTHTEYKIKCSWPAEGKKWTCRRRPRRRGLGKPSGIQVSACQSVDNECHVGG